MAMDIVKETESNKIVEKAKAKLEFKDYLVFGLVGNGWDLIAINDTHIRFIQVSCVPLYSRGVAYKRKLKEFPLLDTTSKEYWYHVDGYFKKKFISDGVERDRGDFFDKIKKNRTKSYSSFEFDSIGEIQNDPTIPF